VTWNLADAKNRFSELVSKALHEGPQHVRRRKDAVVVLSEAEYERLSGRKPRFKDYLMRGEGLDEVDLARDKSPSRDVEL
jgi:antitoxin Phd